MEVNFYYIGKVNFVAPSIYDYKKLQVKSTLCHYFIHPIARGQIENLSYSMYIILLNCYTIYKADESSGKYC